MTKGERICWFCEQDVHEVHDKAEKPKIGFKETSKKTIIDDFKDLGTALGRGYKKAKEKISKKKK